MASKNDKTAYSLPFEIVAVPQSDNHADNSIDNVSPINVKIKVRNKEETGKLGIISMPKLSAHNSGKKVRLVNSDQTIMSFEFLAEDKTSNADRKKNHRNIFHIFKRSGGGNKIKNKNLKEDSYSPTVDDPSIEIKSMTNDDDQINTDENIAWKKNFLLSNNDMTVRMPRLFMGKCKPGGCLDPPFYEDFYSYELNKKESPSICKDTYQDLNSTKGTTNYKTKVTSGLDKLVDSKNAKTTDVTNDFEKDIHSLVTYPSLSLNSEKNLKDRRDSNLKSRLSEEDKAKLSTSEFSEIFFIFPKKDRAKINTAKNEAEVKTNLKTSNESKEEHLLLLSCDQASISLLNEDIITMRKPLEKNSDSKIDIIDRNKDALYKNVHKDTTEYIKSTEAITQSTTISSQSSGHMYKEKQDDLTIDGIESHDSENFQPYVFTVKPPYESIEPTSKISPLLLLKSDQSSIILTNEDRTTIKSLSEKKYIPKIDLVERNEEALNKYDYKDTKECLKPTEVIIQTTTIPRQSSRHTYEAKQDEIIREGIQNHVNKTSKKFQPNEFPVKPSYESIEPTSKISPLLLLNSNQASISLPNKDRKTARNFLENNSISKMDLIDKNKDAFYKYDHKDTIQCIKSTEVIMQTTTIPSEGSTQKYEAKQDALFIEDEASKMNETSKKNQLSVKPPYESKELTSKVSPEINLKSISVKLLAETDVQQKEPKELHMAPSKLLPDSTEQKDELFTEVGSELFVYTKVYPSDVQLKTSEFSQKQQVSTDVKDKFYAPVDSRPQEYQKSYKQSNQSAELDQYLTKQLQDSIRSNNKLFAAEDHENKSNTNINKLKLPNEAQHTSDISNTKSYEFIETTRNDNIKTSLENPKKIDTSLKGIKSFEKPTLNEIKEDNIVDESGKSKEIDNSLFGSKQFLNTKYYETTVLDEIKTDNHADIELAASERHDQSIDELRKFSKTVQNEISDLNVTINNMSEILSTKSSERPLPKSDNYFDTNINLNEDQSRNFEGLKNNIYVKEASPENTVSTTSFSETNIELNDLTKPDVIQLSIVSSAKIQGKDKIKFDHMVNPETLVDTLNFEKILLPKQEEENFSIKSNASLTDYLDVSKTSKILILTSSMPSLRNMKDISIISNHIKHLSDPGKFMDDKSSTLKVMQLPIQYQPSKTVFKTAEIMDQMAPANGNDFSVSDSEKNHTKIDCTNLVPIIHTLNDETNVQVKPSIDISETFKDALVVAVDFKFQYCMDNNGKSVITTLNPAMPYDKFQENIIVIKSIIRKNDDEIRIPINSDIDLTLQIKKVKELIEYPSLSHQERNVVEVQNEIETYKDSLLQETLNIVYQNLVPLETIIKDLKEEASLISRQQVVNRKTLQVLENKPIRLIRTSPQCCCTKIEDINYLE